MKKNIVIILFLLTCIPSIAASINPAAYRTMQMQAYQQSRYRKQSQKQIPYWQLQSNYSTRNKMYNNYTNYTNSTQSNYNQYYRGY